MRELGLKWVYQYDNISIFFGIAYENKRTLPSTNILE